MTEAPRVATVSSPGSLAGDIRVAEPEVRVAPQPVTPSTRMSPRAHWLLRLWKLKLGVLGAVVVVAMIAIAILAPLIAAYDPLKQDLGARLVPPVWEATGSWAHPLGTDRIGRDTLTRLMWGARISLATGALAVLLSLVIGVTLGMLSGYYAGVVDSVISGLVNLLLAFPFILLAMAIVAVLGPSFTNMIVALGLTTWPIFTRVVRAEVLRARHQDFVTAATMLGAGDARVMARHIFPVLVNSVIVLGSLEIARLIILESFLSFLGLGVQPPTPSWGNMLAEARTYILQMWWLVTLPGLALFVTALGVNLCGDALRDLLDPHLKHVQD
jgi:ABC-type dipeptide/oligopeptide/nickel transport system permease subunit